MVLPADARWSDCRCSQIMSDSDVKQQFAQLRVLLSPAAFDSCVSPPHPTSAAPSSCELVQLSRSSSAFSSSPAAARLLLQTRPATSDLRLETCSVRVVVTAQAAPVHLSPSEFVSRTEFRWRVLVGATMRTTNKQQEASMQVPHALTTSVCSACSGCLVEHSEAIDRSSDRWAA